MSVRACCSFFGGLLECQGQAGLSIVPVRIPRIGDGFRLEFHARDQVETEPLPLPDGVRLVIGVQQFIKYCPFCGTKLARFYRKSFESPPFVIDESP